MKAVEWVGEFISKSPEEVLNEFGKETVNLITERTRNSKQDSRFSAIDGAIREQQNKFRSIRNKIPTLTQEMFDQLIEKFVPEYKNLKKKEEDKKEKYDDVAEYRKKKKR